MCLGDWERCLVFHRTIGTVDGEAERCLGQLVEQQVQLSAFCPDADIFCLCLADFLDSRDAKYVEQSSVGVNLAIAVAVVGVGECRLRMLAGTAQYTHDVVARQQRVGLQP